jgi:hypothetical protein
VLQGQSYRIRMEFVSVRKDGDTATTGLEGATIKSSLAVPFRRWLSEPWFKPIARIGAIGSDEYPLGNSDGLGLGNPILEAQITARTSGELFFFVNDLLPISVVSWNFHAGNRGKALVSVTPITQSR